MQVFEEFVPNIGPSASELQNIWQDFITSSDTSEYLYLIFNYIHNFTFGTHKLEVVLLTGANMP